MIMSDIRDIHMKIRDKFPPSVLCPTILQEIIEILFDYVEIETITTPEPHPSIKQQYEADAEWVRMASGINEDLCDQADK